MNTCRSCGAEILWIRTLGGKMMPVNPGTVNIREGAGYDVLVAEDGRILRGVISDDGGSFGYVSHFATCPGASAHRRKKK